MAIAGRPHSYTFASSAKAGEVQNFPDWARGWGLTFDAGQSGGVPPMEWFNSSYKWLNEGILYSVQRGICPWSNDYDYPAGAYVSYNNLVWLSKADSKNVTPGTNSAVWGGVSFQSVVTGPLTATIVTATTIDATGNIGTTGVFNSANQITWTNAGVADWTQGAFHKQSQPYALDNKTTWLVSTNTQYSNGYSMMSRFGMRRDGFDYNGGFELQHVGEGNARLGRWSFNRGGVFESKHITLNKDTDGNTAETESSQLVFRRKQAQANRRVLGSILWDSFRDVSDPSYVAGIWAEGAGTAANWGELKFGVKTNGGSLYPDVKMSITESGVEVIGNLTPSQCHTYYLKSRDVAGAIADKGRDWNGVSELLRWQNYGNGHVIFDASSGRSPTGVSIDPNNPKTAWSTTYPTLMGWNGQDTFGVRVDAARYADFAYSLGNAKPITNGISVETSADPRYVMARSGQGSAIMYLGAGLVWNFGSSIDGITESARRMTLFEDGSLNTEGPITSRARRVALEGRCKYDGAIYQIGAVQGTGTPPDGFVVTQFTAAGANSEAGQIWAWGTFLKPVGQ